MTASTVNGLDQEHPERYRLAQWTTPDSAPS